MNNKKLVEKIKRYKDLQAKQIEIEMELQEIKEVVKKVLSEEKVDEMIIDSYKISVLKYTKNTFDSRVFRSKYEELYKNYCYSKEIESVVIK